MASAIPASATVPQPLAPTVPSTSSLAFPPPNGEFNPYTSGPVQHGDVTLTALTLPLVPTTIPSSVAGLGPSEFLDEGVPPKVKAAIVACQYVELSKLDKEAHNEVAYDIRVGETDDDVSL